MIDEVITLAAARAYRYGAWAGDPKGRSFVEGHCAKAVWSAGRAAREYQCGRKAVAGPNNLYCKQHAPDNVAAKRAARDREYEEKWERRRVIAEIQALDHAADLLRAASQIGPAEACEALAERKRKELDARAKQEKKRSSEDNKS